MNIFSWAFGDPAAAQAGNTAQFVAARRRLTLARARGDQAAIARAMAELKAISTSAQAQAAAAVKVANAPAAAGQAVSGALHGMLTSPPVLVAAAVFAGLVFIRATK